MRLAATHVLGRLLRLGKPVLTTQDAALSLGMTVPAASRALARLAAAGLVLPVRRGLWSLDRRVDPLRLAEHLTAPFPAYVSLQSALFLHGMLSQIPQVVFVASLAPTRTVKTRLGVFSVHRLAPRFFGGFETTADGVRLARPEKALLDVLYLAPARSRLFARLPEIEIPSTFAQTEARRWVRRIPRGPRRTAVEARLQALLARAGEPAGARRRRRGPRGLGAALSN
jgi:hypothetical protein